MEINLLNRTINLVAKRNSGKSVLLKYLVSTCKSKWDKIFVICPSESVNHFYKEFVPENCIFDEWSEGWVESLIAKMSKINGEAGAEKKNVLLIMDDCCSDTNFHASPTLKKLYTRGRHINISIILTTQYLNQLPPVCRSNADYLIAGQMNRMSISILCDEYLAGDLDRTEFIKLFNRATKDYNFLLINCNSIADNENLNEIYGIIKTPENFVK